MKALLTMLTGFDRFSRFAWAVAVRVPRRPWFVRETIEHAWVNFVRCYLPVVAVTLPYGMVVALQGLEIFHIFGAERLLPSLVSVSVLRELSPVMASVLVAAQGGSSIAAELGAMRIKEELDATEVMAVDPIAYHVVPRVLGITLATPLLNVAGSISGLAGGYLTAVWIKGEPGGIFLAEMWGLTGVVDIWAGLVKTAIFGLIIGLTASYNGFYASGGAEGVGRAVNNTVVNSVLVFITANYFLTSALFGGMSQ